LKSSTGSNKYDSLHISKFDSFQLQNGVLIVDKKELIRNLEEMVVILELKGENPFKIRAFANASRIIQGLSGDVLQLIKEGQIIQVKGIGKGIADFLAELVKTGTSSDLERFRTEIPLGLLEMLKIPGMGPKKVKAVWEMLGITTVGELEYACKENRLIDIEGFGQKTQDKILAGIELLKKYSERHLISEVREVAQEIFDKLKKIPEINRIEIAGSLRRWKETIKDIDLLASAQPSDRQKIMNHFVNLPEVETISVQGLTKSSVVLNNGIQVDLRIVSDDQYPYALHHLTGSKEHNVAMREHARKLHLRMNEYGLFKESGDNIPCRDESDIYAHLKMQYIQPELRENYGEIEAALNNEIPELINSSDINGVIHVHSQYSDGVNTISELAEYCKKNGFQYLVICDHSKSAAYANGLTVDQIRQQQDEIDNINTKMQNFRVLKGIECDILSDGSLDYQDDILVSFDIVIASIHSKFNMSESESTKRVITAMKNPHVTIIGHPTGRLLQARKGYPINMNAVIEAASKLQLAIELNANPHRLDIDWRFLRYAKEKKVMISINPDAHRLDGISDIDYGIGIARKGWLTKNDVLNCLTAEKLTQFANNRR
jgi:DNA polymerase (family 10)